MRNQDQVAILKNRNSKCGCTEKKQMEQVFHHWKKKSPILSYCDTGLSRHRPLCFRIVGSAAVSAGGMADGGDCMDITMLW